MQSRVDVDSPAAALQGAGSFRYRLVQTIAFSWGFCAYFPIGVMYLNVLLMLIALAIFPDLGTALARLRRHVVLLPLTLFVAWTLIAALAGDWYPDTSTRLFHTFRVALVLCMGMILTPGQARAAFDGIVSRAQRSLRIADDRGEFYGLDRKAFADALEALLGLSLIHI